MTSSKKKICFYSILASGHLNVCTSLAKVLLDRHSDKVEVYFIVDQIWAKKLSALDDRFKFGIFNYENKQDEKRMANIVDKLEECLHLNLVDKLEQTWRMFIEDETLLEVDLESEKQIKLINPDLLICDQGWHLPAMINSKKPYSFIASCNPLIYSFPDFPTMGSDARVDDKKAIKEFNDKFSVLRSELRAKLNEFLEKRGVKFEHPTRHVDNAMSDHFNIYSYVKELDYYNDKQREENHLWQIDTPLYPGRLPPPFKLPVEFEKLPEKTIIYVSLGSMFSAYTHILQRLVFCLDKLPYKYIFSKGLNGDKLKFPSNKFIGENYIDQLAVLQIVDAAIIHGGNNSFNECFYFGVKTIVMPVLADQINNATRIKEMQLGESLDLMKYTDDELATTLKNLLADENLKQKLKKISDRIQKDNKIFEIADKVVDYVYKL